MSGYLGTYKGERYHIPDFYRDRQPTGPREVFNQAHSSLRNVIERTFGVWKKKWKILETMPNFSFNKQVKIIIATMALQNYITRYAQCHCHFDESKNHQDEETHKEMDANEESHETNGPGAQEIELLRNQITTGLMGD
ncbi:hypothetical protein Ddye_013207 [Dipteronia dyeriana]|uniref:DDE Tnp4 domain-containing protein n=1 Tax=Dipteronia dyeriana TaxID=168575 RepID=A0AAE0CJE7_9ROSI|nr:hypothetical protein Ddye_013207 [Dipteronia dyeriana]